MDHLFLVVVSGIASGAVYGLLGLGLVIIYRATDVMNFALAAMATLAVYVAITVIDRGLGVLAGVVAAIVVAVVVGLVVREFLLRPLGAGKLFAAQAVNVLSRSIERNFFLGKCHKNEGMLSRMSLQGLVERNQHGGATPVVNDSLAFSDEIVVAAYDNRVVAPARQRANDVLGMA